MPKTGAERTRAWRERKRAIEGRDPTPKRKKTRAEIERDSRVRRKARANLLLAGSVGSDVILQYSELNKFQLAHAIFIRDFVENSFGFTCYVCDRLWFKNDLKPLSIENDQRMQQKFPEFRGLDEPACVSCRQALRRGNIPTLSTLNGFVYPPIPEDLPKLDMVSERLISPRIAFMQIRRLRHVNEHFVISGQVINVPVNINTMVEQLPRNIDDDHCIYVHIKRKKIQRSHFLTGFINKNNLKVWLRCLIPSPLYQMYDIKVDESFFAQESIGDQVPTDELCEDIPIEETLIAQQQTLLFDDDKYFRIAPGEMDVPHSLIFDDHAEELSFPTIYLGQLRNFSEDLNITPFMMASSEMRRTDRRGVTPHHLLYMAMKIMRLRVRDSLAMVFKHVSKDITITRQQIQSEEYVNQCVESNLAFLRCIPNSTWFWAERKRDLFAMIRQLGKPTLFLSMSANELGWPLLLQLLYKLKNNGLEISKEVAERLDYIEKSTLINEDAVTCAIYFNRLINVLMDLLQSKKSSPFGKYRVAHFYKKIEFQHGASPQAHILLWLDNAPVYPFGADRLKAIELIDTLVSVATSEASGHIELQTHQHTIACYKTGANVHKKCRFEAPFMPCRYTAILTPMQKEEAGFSTYRQHYHKIRANLESYDYADIDSFYKENQIISDDYYMNVLRASINNLTVFVKRHPMEKWNNPFNPFIFNHLNSSMDIQFITGEHSLATYLVDYVNKTNRGISNLQRSMIEIMDEHPEFNIAEITEKLSINMVNTIEMTTQEAAWYMLREPMAKSSSVVVDIPTIAPIKRQGPRKPQKDVYEVNVDDDTTNIGKEYWFDKYAKRPNGLEDISLAQFVAHYTLNNEGSWSRRKETRIIRYGNYNMADNSDDYKREMVTLFLPFRDEESEIVAEKQFIQMYDDNELLISERHQQFSSNVDIPKTIKICEELCREDEPNNDEEARPLQELYNAAHTINDDLRLATLSKLRAIAKKRENLMSNELFYELMKIGNERQTALLIHLIANLLSSNNSPFQIFFTGEAACRKTFLIKIMMEVYDRFKDIDGFYNSYMTYASTGKASVAIDDATTHISFKISLSKLLSLPDDVAQQHRTLLKYVQVVLIDEIMILEAELLSQIDSRLKQLTGNFHENFGGMDIVLIGDQSSLGIQGRLAAPELYRDVRFYESNEIMRQANATFSYLLTKLENNVVLEEEEIQLIESRFYTREEADRLCPDGIRLYSTDDAVNEYNLQVLNSAVDKTFSRAVDVFSGCHNEEEEEMVREKLHEKSVIDTGGLPYEIILTLNKWYTITSGLNKGAVGKLVHIEPHETGAVLRVWLELSESTRTSKITKKQAAFIQANNISEGAVPISRKTFTIYMNDTKTRSVKRDHLPLVLACAITIEKCRGTFNEIVYEYEKTHTQQHLHTALSGVTSLQGLYIVAKDNKNTFYHGRKCDKSIVTLQEEFRRLSTNPLIPLAGILKDFFSSPGMSPLTCQSISAHNPDLSDPVIHRCNVLILSETLNEPNHQINLPNFHCAVQFKRQDVRTRGVAVLHRTDYGPNIVTKNMSLTSKHLEGLSMRMSSVGEMCVAECRTESGERIMVIVVYISPNQSIADIIKFIHVNLLRFTTLGASVSGDEMSQIPMIMGGEFNVNFASDDAKVLIQFLEEKLFLKMDNRPTEATPHHRRPMNAIFSRYLERLESRVFIIYLSYHKSVDSVLNIDDDEMECDPQLCR